MKQPSKANLQLAQEIHIDYGRPVDGHAEALIQVNAIAQLLADNEPTSPVSKRAIVDILFDCPDDKVTRIACADRIMDLLSKSESDADELLKECRPYLGYFLVGKVDAFLNRDLEKDLICGAQAQASGAGECGDANLLRHTLADQPDLGVRRVDTEGILRSLEEGTNSILAPASPEEKSLGEMLHDKRRETAEAHMVWWEEESIEIQEWYAEQAQAVAAEALRRAGRDEGELIERIEKHFGKGVHLMHFNNPKQAKIILDCKEALAAIDARKKGVA